jgi:TRAP-type C4-dicarboxylate transport system permease small subunit
MKQLRWFFANIEYVVGAAFSAIMVLLLFVQVVSRYVFGFSIAFTEEVALMLFILSVYLGAVGATRRKQHLRIEVVVNLFKPRSRTILAIVANIVFMATNAVLIYGLSLVTLNLKKFGMRTPLTLTPKWMVYAILPLVFVVISIRLSEDCLHLYRELKAPEKPAANS